MTDADAWSGIALTFAEEEPLCPNQALTQELLEAAIEAVAEPRRVPPWVPWLRREQVESSGVAAVFGQWPGDETEAEILAALRRMREP